MQTNEKDTTIIESVEHASPMLKHVAIRYHYDYDDLYQVAAEAALKAYDGAQQAQSPIGYMHRAVRNAILTYTGLAKQRKHTLADHYLIESLDAAHIHDDSPFSLYSLVGDTTASPTREQTRDFSRLYAILNAIPDIYREVLCMRFGLLGYGEHRPTEVASILGVSLETVDKRFCRAKKMLREYIDLLDLVGG